MKKICLILILGVLLFSACTPDTSPIATENPEEEGLAVIRVGTSDDNVSLAPHQTIIQNFEELTPNIMVQLEAVTDRDYYARLLTQLEAKAAPDIIQIEGETVLSFVEKGAFLPLDNMMTAKGFDPAIYLPGLLEPGQVDGVQYLLPKNYSTLGIYYNKTIFDNAGLAYPQDDWTWADMLDIALELTEDLDDDGKIDIWGIQLPATWTAGLEYWVAAAGGSLISENGKKFVGYMDSEEAIRAVQFYADLYNKYRVAPMPADLNVLGGGNTEFANGQAAMYIFGRWPQSELLENPNVDLGLAPLPMDAKRANVLFWDGFGIASTTQHSSKAYTFLSYYAGEGGAEVWKDWTLPVVKSVADSAGLSADPIEGVWINELNFLVPRAYTFTIHWNEIADPILRKALETVILEQRADVAAVMQQAAQEAQAALDAVE